MARGAIIEKPGPELTDAEMAALGPFGVPQVPNLTTDPATGQTSLTEAELLVLGLRGATTAVSDSKGEFDDEDPYAVENGAYLFKIGRGDSQFTGRIVERSGDRSKVKLWHRETGMPANLGRAHLMYYLSKGCWLPRPPAGVDVPEMSIACPSTWKKCKKRFHLPQHVYDHFRSRHQREHRAVEEQRQRERQDQLGQMLENQVASGGAVAPGDNAMAALLMELVDTVRGASGQEPKYADAVIPPPPPGEAA